MISMRRVLWQLAFALIACKIVDVAAGNVCNDGGKPSLCSCVDSTADCSELLLTVQPDKESWNYTSHITKVILSSNYLTEILPFPALPIEYLSLANNSIKTIQDGSFMLLSNLTHLDLSMNLLHSDELRPDIFKGLYLPGAYEPLTKLRTLYLSYNELHTLHPDLFEHMPKLETLFIDGNPLKVIDKSTVVALSSILGLKTLSLANTRLKTLPEFMLHTPRLLLNLDLSENEFTSVPEEIQHTHNLNTLILDDNPIKSIDSFPALDDLEKLQLNFMPYLERIGPEALSNLTNLKELQLRNNVKLREVAGTALSSPLTDNSDARAWPPLARLYLDNSMLPYLENELVGRWDLLDVVNISGNPWVCDCKNQWLVSTLIPHIKKLPLHSTNTILCQEPIEMKGMLMEDLEERNYQMRCLDSYGHRPERDGALLVGLIIGVMMAIPFTMAAVVLYKRRNLRPAATQHFSRAFYKPADSKQFFVNM